MLAKIATIFSFVIFASLFGWQVWVASMQPYNQTPTSYRKQYSGQKIEPWSADERLATYTEWLAAFIGSAAWKIFQPAILNRAGILVVYGEIRYFDTFQDRVSAEPRRTKYRFLVPVDDEGISDGGLAYAEEGNEST